MRFMSFSRGGVPRFGIASGSEVIDLTDSFAATECAISAMYSGAIDYARFDNAPRYALGNVEFRPPVSNGRIFCIGYNYHDHLQETKSTDRPVTVFLRNPASVVGHAMPLVHGEKTSCYDYEGELAAVIGASGRAGDIDEALRMIAGYTCFMDGSARDYQAHSVGAGKNFDASGAIGPWVVSADEITDPQDLTIETRVNGELMQRDLTANMLRSVAEIVVYVSGFASLRPGDVIATGTPGGVGVSQQPPRWLVPGDRVEVEISSIGTLCNDVIDAAMY